MSSHANINFTYDSPRQDIQNCTGQNPDESVNIKYTLITLRNLLLENVDIVNKLIEKSNNITDITHANYGKIKITFNSKEEFETLFNEKILTACPNLDNSDIEEEQLDVQNNGELVIEHFSDHETNNDRLTMINNVLNQDDTLIMFDKGSDSDSESHPSSDEIISDEQNMKSIIDKYMDLIKIDNESDNESIDGSEKEIDNY